VLAGKTSNQPSATRRGFAPPFTLHPQNDCICALDHRNGAEAQQVQRFLVVLDHRRVLRPCGQRGGLAGLRAESAKVFDPAVERAVGRGRAMLNGPVSLLPIAFSLRYSGRAFGRARRPAARAGAGPVRTQRGHVGLVGQNNKWASQQNCSQCPASQEFHKAPFSEARLRGNQGVLAQRKP